ncbi:MAG: DUF3943 domain-containing protein [Fibrobacter sp.]|nr:DUF3943 domain-containing protein [Fibrobacter sp.]
MKTLPGIFAFLIFVSLSMATETSPADSLKQDSTISATAEFAPREPQGQKLPVIIPFAEVTALNALVWAWDRYVLQKNYAKTGPSYWKRNFKEGWKWDNNHFAINFFGHPYQGSMYYSAARSAGYDFYAGFFFALAGSWMWEEFCETEYPAPNDLLATSIGGTIYGEMLYRIAERATSKPGAGILENLFSFAASPVATVQEWINGPSPTNPGYAPIRWSVFAGAGLRFGNEFRYDEDVDKRSDNDWNALSAFYGLDLAYGRPDRKIKEPFEYFTFSFTQDQSEAGMMMRVSSIGKLNNLNMRQNSSNWMDLASYLHFDTFYGDLVEMSALSIGLGADVSVELSERFHLRMTHMPSYVILGSSDFNYDEVLAAADSNYKSTRNYQYSLGGSYKVYLELEWKNRGKIADQASAYIFRSWPNTEPHYGTKGYDFVAFNNFFIEAYLPLNFAAGIRLNSYAKIAAYERVEPMSRTMHALGVYVRYNI